MRCLAACRMESWPRDRNLLFAHPPVLGATRVNPASGRARHSVRADLRARFSKRGSEHGSEHVPTLFRPRSGVHHFPTSVDQLHSDGVRTAL
jgi:hypothetical protein